jgi:hypothetical protein
MVRNGDPLDPALTLTQELLLQFCHLNPIWVPRNKRDQGISKPEALFFVHRSPPSEV